ncbi:MAG: OmpH family outer membrane protein [Myxococcota bacterium]
MRVTKRMLAVVVLAHGAGLYAPAAAADTGLRQEVKALRQEVEALKRQVQKPRFAYLDLWDLREGPLAKTAEGAGKLAKLQEDLAQRQAKLDARQKEFQGLQQELAAGQSGILKPEALQQKQRRIQQVWGDMQKMYAESQSVLARKEKELVEQLMPKAVMVVRELEKERGISILRLPKKLAPVGEAASLPNLEPEFVSRYNKRYPWVPASSSGKKGKRGK